MKIVKEKRCRKSGGAKTATSSAKRTDESLCIVEFISHYLCLFKRCGAKRARRGNWRVWATPRDNKWELAPYSILLARFPARVTSYTCICMCVCRDCANTITYRAERESVNTAPPTPSTLATTHHNCWAQNVNCGHARVLLHCFLPPYSPLCDAIDVSLCTTWWWHSVASPTTRNWLRIDDRQSLNWAGPEFSQSVVLL